MLVAFTIKELADAEMEPMGVSLYNVVGRLTSRLVDNALFSVIDESINESIIHSVRSISYIHEGHGSYSHEIKSSVLRALQGSS